MENTFYWYDLETSGTEPKWDRIVQFAGLRTDADLNVIGDEFCSYVQLPDDVLPNPQATLVTGITPQITHAKGMSETSALVEINRLFSKPNTCVAGYNSLRFDDEFIRYSFYRNMLDPYAREWQQGNSRWDLIDLVRATGALRREGIEWPTDEEGLPVYKLEELTKANGIEHGQAHDAMSDVVATAGMARLIKEKQPRLFEYYFNLRNKKAIRTLLEPYGATLCVQVSAMYPRERYGVAPIVSVCRHPTNSNSVIVVDLAQDVEPLLSLPAEALAEKLFTPGAEERPPLREVRLNRCPFIAQVEVLSEENLARTGIDLKAARERARRLRQPGLTEKLARVYTQPRPKPAADPDAALYDGFLQDDDRSRCQSLHADLAKGIWRDMDFSDKRLHALAKRMKARSFPSLLDPEEIAPWRSFVREKLSAEGDWLNLPEFDAQLDEMLKDPQLNERDYALLVKLGEHAQDVRDRYEI